MTPSIRIAASLRAGTGPDPPPDNCAENSTNDYAVAQILRYANCANRAV
ncbi:MAG: hypothetical protein M3N97_06510 [Pseudomonadota bacterium]|nr:hypothetical protein [Pseudomonadota bacterium]